MNKVPLKLLAIFFVSVLASSALGQANSSLFAKAFSSLGASRIDNEIMISDNGNPSVVVLSKQASGENLSLLSMTDGKLRTEWHLAQLPQFMATVDPTALRVTMTDDGPVISLHGCAAHLCGGKGLAGALTYVVNQHRMYTAFASWSDSENTAKIVYSSGDSTPISDNQKKFLDSMLREEKYNP